MLFRARSQYGKQLQLTDLFFVWDNEGMDILKKIYSIFIDTFQTILITASVIMVLYAFVIQPNEVSGSSMYPTFKDKEFLLSSLLDVRFSKYTRGDVIVFHSPVEPEKLYIKRVIALPGDSIALEGGKVFLNGGLLDESEYLSPDITTQPGAFLREGEIQTIPDGAVWVMGDNRPYSSDSREWGFLDKGKIVGKSIVRILPVSQFQIIRNPYKE